MNTRPKLKVHDQKQPGKWMGYAAWILLVISLGGMLAVQTLPRMDSQVSALQEEVFRLAEEHSGNLAKLQEELRIVAAERPFLKELQVDSFESNDEVSINAEDYEILSGVENLVTLFHYQADDLRIPITVMESTRGTSSMMVHVGVVQYRLLGNLLVLVGAGAAGILFILRRNLKKVPEECSS